MEKKYQIIYADPPWDIKIISRYLRPNQKDMPYDRMSLDAIKNLEIIPQIVNPEGCHLFLWATHKYLPMAFEVMNSWGFSYHCCLTWDKTYGMTPFSFMFSTEFCLYGQLKNKWMKLDKLGIKTHITEKPKGHSFKPESMRRLIVDACGDLPKIELFARIQYPGWDVWGNEAGTVENDYLF